MGYLPRTYSKVVLWDQLQTMSSVTAFEWAALYPLGHGTVFCGS